MHIAGLQRCSLVDYPGQTCCTVFTQGCNLRCPWCHNSELVPPRSGNELPEADCWELLLKRQGKVAAVTVTGGEPTLQPDLPEFLATIKAMGFAVKLDTNGTKPGVLRKLLREELVDVMAMDVKAPLNGSYVNAAGRDVSIKALRESVTLLKEAAIPTEFRTTVVPGMLNADDIAAIARELAGGRIYYLQAFAPSHAADEAMRRQKPPAPEFMEICQARASEWIETRVR